MTAELRGLERFRRRIALGWFLYEAAGWLAGYLLAAGTAILLVKLAAPRFWPHVLWTLAGIGPVLIAAWVRSLRNVPAERHMVALLDRKLNAGGLLMSYTETRDDRWHDAMSHPPEAWTAAIPRIRPRRFARIVGLPVLFALSASLVPVRDARTGQPRLENSAGFEAAQELADMVEVLQEAGVLDADEARQIGEQISKLEKDAAQAPLTHEKWETVDALRNRGELRLEAAARAIEKSLAAVEQLDKLLNRGEHDRSVPADELIKQLANALGQLPQRAELGLAPQALEEQLKRLEKEGRFPPQGPEGQSQLIQQLRDQLQREHEKLGQSRQKLAEQMANRDQPQQRSSESTTPPDQSDQPGQPDGATGGEQGRRSGEAKEQPGATAEGGKAGGERGPGDAPLNLSGQTDETRKRFLDVVLPPGLTDEPRDEVTAATANAPNVAEAAPAQRDALRDVKLGSGGSGWNRTLQPRHRGVVRKYFEKGE